jgi:hypothetical protein
MQPAGNFLPEKVCLKKEKNGWVRRQTKILQDLDKDPHEGVSTSRNEQGVFFCARTHFAGKCVRCAKEPVVISEGNPIHFAASHPASGRSVYSC